MAVPRFGEFCFCCCLPLMPQLACSILATWERPYNRALYSCGSNEIKQETASMHSDCKIYRLDPKHQNPKPPIYFVNVAWFSSSTVLVMVEMKNLLLV